MDDAQISHGDNRLLCFDCIHTTLVAGDGKEDQIEMRQFLVEGEGVSVPAAASYLEVLSIYKDAEDGKFKLFLDGIKSVKYPVLPTSALHAYLCTISGIASPRGT